MSAAPPGGSASAAAIDALRPLEARAVPAGELLNALAEAVGDAERAVHGIAGGPATARRSPP